MSIVSLLVPDIISGPVLYGRITVFIEESAVVVSGTVCFRVQDEQEGEEEDEGVGTGDYEMDGFGTAQFG